MTLTQEDLQALSDMMDTKLDIKLEPIRTDMQGMKNDIQNTKNDIQGMKTDMRGMKNDIQNTKNDIQGMKTDMQGMKNDIQNTKNDIQGMKADMQGMKKQITGIELHLENTTDMNIKFIAEGHLDLSRKLDQALESAQERESLLIRVNYLESSVKKINNKFAEIL